MRNGIICTLLFVFVMIMTSCTGEKPADKTLVVSDLKWEFRQQGEEKWMKAEVPGSIHMDLLRNGKIEEPYYRNNEAKYQWIGEKNWEYRTEFVCSAEDIKYRRVTIGFEGLDTFAEVTLNGNKILITDNFFRTWEKDIKSILKEGKNSLDILFKSAHAMTEKAVATYPYMDKKEGKKEPMDRYSMVRKPAYHYGWDWGPKFLTAGIWKPAYIKFVNHLDIDNVFIRQNSISEEKAELTALIEIEAAKSCKATLNIKYGEKTLSKELNLKEGINRAEKSFTIDKPELWWCHGLGKPNLYKFDIELLIKDKSVAEKTVTTGLRTVRVVQNKDEAGKSFYVELNGKPVYMKGANYIPQEMFLNRVKKEDYEKLIKDSIAANMNMLRVWGGGIYEKDIFYDLCDRNGILVWQDFMFACALYPGDDKYIESVRHEAVDNIKRLRNHPSIALWCGNNENYIGWKDWGWKKRYSEEDRKKLEADYERLFHKMLPEVVEQNDPGKFYWPSSPLHGWDYAVNTEGDVHNWGVWHGQHPFDYFEKEENIGRFMSEYGFQGAPSLETVQTFTLPEDRDINSEVMKAHQKHRIGYPVIDKYLPWYYKKPKNFESWLHVSQLLQAHGIRVGIEAHRRAKPFCMGTLYWQLNDCWPVTSWAGIDSRGEWKAQHYMTKKAFADVLISSVKEKGDLKIHMVSDLKRSLNGVLTVEAVDIKGYVKNRITENVELKADESRVVLKSGIKKLLKGGGVKDTVLYCSFKEKNTLLSEAVICLVAPKDLRLKAPSIEYELKSIETGFLLTLKAGSFAKGVKLSAGKCQVHFSDNYFDLLPGRDIKVEVISSEPVEKFRKSLKIVSLYDTY